jgi:hypothetical protein
MAEFDELLESTLQDNAPAPGGQKTKRPRGNASAVEGWGSSGNASVPKPIEEVRTSDGKG